jgi:hypothetical protein
MLSCCRQAPLPGPLQPLRIFFGCRRPKVESICFPWLYLAKESPPWHVKTIRWFLQVGEDLGERGIPI